MEREERGGVGMEGEECSGFSNTNTPNNRSCWASSQGTVCYANQSTRVMEEEEEYRKGLKNERGVR